MSNKSLSVLATICARGGSKGVPGKNIRPLLSKPLISYTIETAKNCSAIGHVVVSTDNDEIASVAEAYGIKVPFRRPSEMATDSAAKIHAIRHAMIYVEENTGFIPDIVVDLDVGAPLRASEDIVSCVKVLETHPEFDAAVTVYEADRNPYFNMVEFDGDSVHLVKIGYSFVARQSAPCVYSVSGSVFAWRRDSLMAMSATHLYQGKWGGCIIPRERAIDIDYEIDFEFVEFLMGKKLCNG
jgi:CMP-N,N'-diacetyllegionaminic acid synthase